MTFATETEALEFVARMIPQAEVAVIPTTHNYWVITSHKAVGRPAQICSICHQPFQEFSNNARPVNDGRCCAYCDDHVVTPARIAQVNR